MAKDKERSVNPAQQARKQEKNRALKKAKSEQQARRNEKFARRNPDRIQRQIEDLKALEASGEIKPREKAVLADLERELKAVHKAREALGEKAPTFGNIRTRQDRGDGGKREDGGVLGKRGRDGERRHNQHSRDRHSDSGDETDASVRAIPMPRDTPPPIPREFRHNKQQRYHHHKIDANTRDQPDPHQKMPGVEHKTTYSSAPQLRDLRKEATSRFVPVAVKKKQEAIKGVSGGLLEPEEMDRLEEAGYYKSHKANDGIDKGRLTASAHGLDDLEARRLAEEEARFARELAETDDLGVDGGDEVQERRPTDMIAKPVRHHHVHIEEVEDEDL